MKIIFNRNTVSAAVAPLMCAVSGKSTLTYADGILIEAKKPDSCTLTTFDTEKGLRITISATVLEEGSYVINAQQFNKALRVMNSEEISLAVDQKLVATIISGKSSHKVSALPGSDYPSIPDLVSDRSFICGQKIFKRMLAKVAHAMGVNDQRQILNGTFVKITDDSVTMVACDSFKMAKCTFRTELVNKNTNGKDFLDYKFVIPSKTVSEVTRLLDDDDEAVMQIYVTRKVIVFVLGEITFFSRLIDGEYIDYNRIILTDQPIKITLNKEEFYSALERAALITEEKVAGNARAHVKLDLKEEILRIFAISVIGSTYDEVAVTHVGGDLTIAFNNRFLIDSVRSCGGERLTVTLSTPLSSINITPENNNYEENGEEELYMLLPVRTKE